MISYELLVIVGCQGRQVPVFLRDVAPEKLPVVQWTIPYACTYWQR